MLLKDNEATIQQALDSIKPLNAHLLVTDLGSKDSTLKICRDNGVIPVKAFGNRSEIRNNLVSQSINAWQMYLDPWEYLLQGYEVIKDIVTESDAASYHLSVLERDLITKEVRLWRRDQIEFSNPFLDRLLDEGSQFADIVICSQGQKGVGDLKAWRKARPLALEPLYYEACDALRSAEYGEFMKLASHYLFTQKKETQAKTMMRYYVSGVCCYVLNEFQIASEHIQGCLASHVLMAEFWCLLGDTFFYSKDFSKAKIFYENAMILGSRRLMKDKWPIHIPKYSDYPKEMIEKCGVATKTANTYIKRPSPIH